MEPAGRPLAAARAHADRLVALEHQSRLIPLDREQDRRRST
jgi:hypothetical protein